MSWSVLFLFLFLCLSLAIGQETETCESPSSSSTSSCESNEPAAEPVHSIPNPSPIPDLTSDSIPHPVFRRNYNQIKTDDPFRFGSNGNQVGQFSNPFGIASNSKGEIIVCDYGFHRIQILSSHGQPIRQFGSQGSEPGMFNFPLGVSVDPRNDQIIVADSHNNRVQIFDSQGNFLRSFGSLGSGDRQLGKPFAAIVDSDGNYFVTDQQNYRVVVFDENGKFLRKFGSQGTGIGQFKLCRGIAFLSNGHIAVSDAQNSRISIFNKQAEFISNIGVGYLMNPWHLFVDSDDNILVADAGSRRVDILDSKTGKPISTIQSHFIGRPHGVAMDPKGRILTCGDNDRITIF